MNARARRTSSALILSTIAAVILLAISGLAFASDTAATEADSPSPQGPPCTIEGNNRDNKLKGTPGDDVICAGGGNDIVHSRGGEDIVVGEAGKDQIWGGMGADYLLGNEGADRIDGEEGADDLVAGGSGADLILGGAGDDLCVDAVDGTDKDTAKGGPGIDYGDIDPGDKIGGLELDSDCHPV